MTRTVLEWVLSSCLLIAAVLVLRAALGRRIGAGLRYALWLAVLLRLLVPVPLFTSTVVGMSAPEIPALTTHVPENVTLQEDAVPPASVPAISDPDVLSPDIVVTADSDAVTWADVQTRPNAAAVQPWEAVGIFWGLGAATVAAVLLASNVSFALRLRRRRRVLETDCPLPVYIAAGLPSPCLFGLIRPAIYVTPDTAAEPAMLRHVLAHEFTHARHLDHIWSFLRAAALAVHWWNPLVWLAVVLSRRDGELACDEGALRRLGDGERRAYGETLLALVTAKSGPQDLLFCATTMSDGKKLLQDRVRLIAHRPRRMLGAMAAAVAVLALAVLCAFGRKEAPAADTGVDQETEQMDAQNPLGSQPLDGQDWRDAEIMVDGDGIPYIRYGEDQEWEPLGGPIASPAEWKEQVGLAGRSEMTALPGDIMEIWAGLVSSTDGWLTACIGQGVAIADIYVYKTDDGGKTWTEVTKPCVTGAGEEVHTWHVSTAGFISPERMIVACRLFDGAPCFITKDGGETWEQIAIPEGALQVQSIHVETGVVTMAIGHEGQETRYVMTSGDLGETWETAEAQDSAAGVDYGDLPDAARAVLPLQAGERVLSWAAGDLNGDGHADLAAAIQRAETGEKGQTRELTVLWGGADGYAAGPSNKKVLWGSAGGYMGGPATVTLGIEGGAMLVQEDCDWWCTDLTFSFDRRADAPVLTQARYWSVELAAGEHQVIYTATEERYDLTDGTYSLWWYQGTEGAFWNDPAAEGKPLCSYQHKGCPLWSLEDIPVPWGDGGWEPLAEFPPLPPLPYPDANPDRWRTWEQSMPLEYTPKEILDAVKEALYPDAVQVSYQWTDEMRENWNELAGAEMPDYFYRDGTVELSYCGLIYDTSDGGIRFYRHTMAVQDGDVLNFINLRDECAAENIQAYQS